MHTGRTKVRFAQYLMANSKGSEVFCAGFFTQLLPKKGSASLLGSNAIIVDLPSAQGADYLVEADREHKVRTSRFSEKRLPQPVMASTFEMAQEKGTI